MSKVLFFNIAAYGHTYPTLPLVAKLVRRGEQVIYYSSGCAFQQAIESTGATFRNSATSFLNDDTQIDESMIKVACMLLQVTETSLVSLLPEVREEKPDYIIHDGLSPWGKYIAHIAGVPSISSMTTFAIPPLTLHNFGRLIASPATSKLLLLSTPVGEVARMVYEGRRDIPRFQALSNRLRKTYGLPRLQMPDMFTNRGQLNIV